MTTRRQPDAAARRRPPQVTIEPGMLVEVTARDWSLGKVVPVIDVDHGYVTTAQGEAFVGYSLADVRPPR